MKSTRWGKWLLVTDRAGIQHIHDFRVWAANPHHRTYFFLVEARERGKVSAQGVSCFERRVCTFRLPSLLSLGSFHWSSEWPLFLYASVPFFILSWCPQNTSNPLKNYAQFWFSLHTSRHFTHALERFSTWNKSFVSLSFSLSLSAVPEKCVCFHPFHGRKCFVLNNKQKERDMRRQGTHTAAWLWQGAR